MSKKSSAGGEKCEQWNITKYQQLKDDQQRSGLQSDEVWVFFIGFSCTLKYPGNNKIWHCF